MIRVIFIYGAIAGLIVAVPMVWSMLTMTEAPTGNAAFYGYLSMSLGLTAVFVGIKQHRDVWAVVSTMGIVDFADAILGGKTRTPASPTGKPARRTRLNETQKNTIKAAIQKLLGDSKDGLSRSEIAKWAPIIRKSGVKVD